MNKLSLFSGIGGDDLASEWAGIETVCFVEKDKYCQQVLKKHWPGIPIIKDVKDVTKEKVRQITGRECFDIISGGDPCQPRSLAGKRRGREDDRDLWPDMFRVIQQFKPAWVVNENPVGRLTMDFHEVLSDLESLGYEARAFVIPACAVNAPHRRDRVFIIAHNDSFRCSGKPLEGQGIQRKIITRNQTDAVYSSFVPNAKCYGIQRRETYRPEGCSLTRNEQLPGFLQFDFRNEISAARIYRDLHGVSPRMDRHRNEMLGNAVVPQQIYPIYRAIMEIEKRGAVKQAPLLQAEMLKL